MTATPHDELKTKDQNVSARGVTLSNDPDLFFHTDAAEQISDQLGYAQGDRELLAKKIFEAIHAGEINAYSMRDGILMQASFDWRRDPESNRANRICNPVHNRFAIAPVNLALPTHNRLTSTKKGSLGFPLWNLEREKSLELSTSTLARLRSTN